jgi:hypothetical protein
VRTCSRLARYSSALAASGVEKIVAHVCAGEIEFGAEIVEQMIAEQKLRANPLVFHPDFPKHPQGIHSGERHDDQQATKSRGKRDAAPRHKARFVLSGHVQTQLYSLVLGFRRRTPVTDDNVFHHSRLELESSDRLWRPLFRNLRRRIVEVPLRPLRQYPQ